MRKSATDISYRCRLITLLLILLVYIVDASQVSIPHKTDFDFNDISIPPNPKEPTVIRRYYIQSECSGMYVRIKIGRKRNSIDASGKLFGKYTSIIKESIGMNGLVRLQGEQSKKYLCFSKKGRLRAQQHPTNEHCNFIYNITQDKKYQFRLQGREEWYIGFKLKKVRHSIRGKALPGYKKNKDGRFKHCFDFTLIPVDKEKPPWTPNFFTQVGDDYNPEKPFRSNRHRDKSGHRIRHASHRKMLRRRKPRNRNRKSRKRKPAS